MNEEIVRKAFQIVVDGAAGSNTKGIYMPWACNNTWYTRYRVGHRYHDIISITREQTLSDGTIVWKLEIKEGFTTDREKTVMTSTDLEWLFQQGDAKLSDAVLLGVEEGYAFLQGLTKLGVTPSYVYSMSSVAPRPYAGRTTQSLSREEWGKLPNYTKIGHRYHYIDGRWFESSRNELVPVPVETVITESCPTTYKVLIESCERGREWSKFRL